MGTRGSFGFRVNGEDKLMYNHSDSYPSGLGLDVLAFLKAVDVSTLSSKAAKLKAVDNDIARPTAAQKAKCRKAGTVDLAVSQRSEDDWYCLLRNAQGDLGKLLKVGFFEEGNAFVLDSIFCEWAYIINLDTGKLEVYEGFNEGIRLPDGKWKPKFPNGRYANNMSDSENPRRIKAGEEPYFGIHLVAEFPLAKLPAEKTFLKETESVR